MTVFVDASLTALGAVLLQNVNPAAYASAALTAAQQNCPQIEKEALAIRYGCKKFHQFIYRRPLIVETDHKHLESISKKPLRKALPHLQRLLFYVQHYAPKNVYIKGKQLVIAGLWSRDCIRAETAESATHDMEVLANIPIESSKPGGVREISTTLSPTTRSHRKNPQGMTREKRVNYQQQRSSFGYSGTNLLSTKTSS